MVYNIDDFKNDQGMGFSWNELGDSAGDLLGGVLDYGTGVLNSQSDNAAAVAAVNMAQAEAIKIRSQRNADTAKNVMKIVILTILSITVLLALKLSK